MRVKLIGVLVAPDAGAGAVAHTLFTEPSVVKLADIVAAPPDGRLGHRRLVRDRILLQLLEPCCLTLLRYHAAKLSQLRTLTTTATTAAFASPAAPSASASASCAACICCGVAGDGGDGDLASRDQRLCFVKLPDLDGGSCAATADLWHHRLR